MANEIVLPDELVKAAHNLEERFQMLRVLTRKTSQAEWDATAPDKR
jgi:hypothetical protein